jgi:hypothetical protein
VLLVTTTNATPAANARYLVGIVNLANAAQTATLALTDNSGSTANLPQIGALGASQVITFPAPGFPCNGFSVVASGTPTTGVAFLWLGPP